MMLWGNVCAVLQHGSRPHRRSGPDLMHSRGRGFGGSSFSVCSSWTFCPFFSWTLACILLPAFYNVLLQLCFMNFLSTQPADAVIWEKLGPATVEPAVQEEQEENSACINDDDGHFRLWRGESFSFKVRAPAPASCHVCYTCLYYLLWWNPALQSLTLQTSNLYLVFFFFFSNQSRKSGKNTCVQLFAVYYTVNINNVNISLLKSYSFCLGVFLQHDRNKLHIHQMLHIHIWHNMTAPHRLSDDILHVSALLLNMRIYPRRQIWSKWGDS